MCTPMQVVERLYRARWTSLDGLGGLILTPTRELALQIFLEMRKVSHHVHQATTNKAASARPTPLQLPAAQTVISGRYDSHAAVQEL